MFYNRQKNKPHDFHDSPYLKPPRARKEKQKNWNYACVPQIRWQKEWDNGETGRSVHNVLPKVRTTPTPWERPEIMFVTDHGLFKRFNIRNRDSCGCGNLGKPCTMLQAACLQPHIT
ncbi:hypothetical protein AVEN_1806-1 [Araneus ventricosus]|uniref:Uncharacterized protein n=1 Tax=Araneus ventricosus TaxID=182803 RepID=A0A4Y2HXL1_ARAVE|nr:hypothetical protein AVEN_1806-1 [Araneus ventricosus]